MLVESNHRVSGLNRPKSLSNSPWSHHPTDIRSCSNLLDPCSIDGERVSARYGQAGEVSNSFAHSSIGKPALTTMLFRDCKRAAIQAQDSTKRVA